MSLSLSSTQSFPNALLCKSRNRSEVSQQFFRQGQQNKTNKILCVFSCLKLKIIHQIFYSVRYSEIVRNCKYICQNSHFYIASLTFSVHGFFSILYFTKLNNLLICKAHNNHSRDLSSSKLYSIFVAHLDNKENTAVHLLPVSKTHTQRKCFSVQYPRFLLQRCTQHHSTLCKKAVLQEV